VACLPLHHPLRLAEEICMVDHLSRGRLELGVGRGISPFEQNFFGHAADEARGRFQESLELILSALPTGRMNTEGRTYYQFPEAELSMETYQKPGVPIWYPGNIEFAGRNGFNAVVPVPPSEAQRAAYQEFIAAGLDSGDRLSPRSSDATLACSQFLVVARTDEQAREIGYRNVTALNNLMRRSSSAAPPHLQDPLPPLPDDPSVPFSTVSAFQREVAICGSPETVRDYFRARAAESDDSYFIVGTAIGDMSLAESEESLQLFLDEVLPAFRDAA
jgi:alkanesulfonate monooxygenase SsuD/methylene tetrahydromethanopterin reductase-like flavin-dependent oxidoreductase (luciferase family)